MSIRRHKVLVIYKSGAQVTVDCDNFKLKTNALGEIASVSWENAMPNPLHIGISDISAIWTLK